MLDESEFLSPYGIRALSRFHKDHPYVLRVDGAEHRVAYEPAESTTGLFGGNSNWRGPIWFPMNFLLIEALQRFDHFYRGAFKVEFPTGSGQPMALCDVAAELSRRLTRIFLRDPAGRRPVHGEARRFQTDPRWRDLLLFYEYFHGDTGAGIGASHQTGWKFSSSDAATRTLCPATTVAVVACSGPNGEANALPVHFQVPVKNAS
jgi:hypothetical protein